MYWVASGDLFGIKIVISSLLLHRRCGQETKRHGEEGLKNPQNVSGWKFLIQNYGSGAGVEAQVVVHLPSTKGHERKPSTAEKESIWV
jgi:hypothetical protein